MLGGEQLILNLKIMKVIKHNMDVTRLDDEVVLNENADLAYWRQLKERASRMGILKRSGIDKNGMCFFVTLRGAYHFRYTLLSD